MLKLRHPLSLLVICLLVMLGVLRSFTPPSPQGADVPDVLFSAIRAEAILRDILQENRPHPAGSESNARVRDRIFAHLEAAGYEPEIQSRFQCNQDFGSCGPIENIIAVKPGSDGRHAVLLTAHYDSGWAGPGAADDGAGVAAILEIARMAADFPPYSNDIVFLFTDGEENGLLGARAFADHHPAFARVKTVVNLEARGVTGPSVLFETGEGNRSMVRVFSKSVERPVANSLVYEFYKRMPNDTDYSVYKGEGRMGLNFAFAQGVSVYHTAIDDADHLDLGSLQHHGDNAWAMLNSLGDRGLGRIASREEAGFIDLFAATLIHYPVSITGGLALFLGVWVMIAISAAFRKEFRYRQLRWGLVAIPFLVITLPLAGYLLSWPLGQWVDMHPLEHPFPWPGRVALMFGTALVAYITLKLFSGRVSACAWMILAWLLVFVFAMVLTRKLPTASHIALVPLAAFALGSMVDLFRRKSAAPLLYSSMAGFAAACFIAWYHFFLLGGLMTFDSSMFLIAPLTMVVMLAMPMLLAFVARIDLDWWPAKWLGVVLLAAVTVHLFAPAFSAERPRDMTLMYREVAGGEKAHLVVESVFGTPDRSYARKHLFEDLVFNSGRLGKVKRPAREVEPLNLPGVEWSQSEPVLEGDEWTRQLRIEAPPGTPLLQLAISRDAGLVSAQVDGQIAFDATRRSGPGRSARLLRFIHPGQDALVIELVTDRPGEFQVAAMTWHELPGVLLAPFLGNWPDDAQPYHYGRRAEKIQEFVIR